MQTRISFLVVSYKQSYAVVVIEVIIIVSDATRAKAQHMVSDRIKYHGNRKHYFTQEIKESQNAEAKI